MNNVKSNGRPMPPGFDAKHYYFRYLRPPDVDGMIKMTRPQNIKIKEQCFVAWSHIFVASQLKSSIKPDIQKQAP